MRDHDNLQSDISAYAARRLDPHDRRDLETHLATCPQCRDLVACAEALALEMRGTDPLGEHPSSEVLEHYARDEGVELTAVAEAKREYTIVADTVYLAGADNRDEALNHE